MGTSNFYCKNASKIYALTALKSEENEHLYYDLGEVIDQAKDELCNDFEYHEANTEHKPLDGRNFNCRELCRKTIEVSFMGSDDILDEFHVCVFVNSGYYEGANLDYRLVISYYESSEYDPKDLVEYLVDSYMENICDDEELCNDRKKAEEFYKKLVDEVCKETEYALSQCCNDEYK